MLKYILVVASLMFAIPQMSVAAATAATTTAPPIESRAYCQTKGGAVQTRTPEYGTNGGTPLPLAYNREFCEFTSADGSTHIDVLLSTLVTSKPTLAALAYYARRRVDLKTCQGGPGSCYCSDVGGTDEFGGISAAGGGWVLTTDVNNVLDVCVFPDLSAIDAYGLFYHAYGIVRGQPLKHKLRYDSPY